MAAACRSRGTGGGRYATASGRGSSKQGLMVAGCRSAVAGRRSPVAGCRSPVAGRRSPLAASCSPVAGRRSPLAASCSPVAACCHKSAANCSPASERRGSTSPETVLQICPLGALGGARRGGGGFRARSAAAQYTLTVTFSASVCPRDPKERLSGGSGKAG